MTTYYLFRHGETYFSKHEVPYNDQILTAPLLPEAEKPLERIGEFLKDIQTDANFASTISRCRQSSQIVGEIANKEFTADERLIEFMEPQESFDNLKKRLEKFLEDISKKDYSAVAICTHGACIAGIKHLLLENDFKQSDLHDYPLTGQVWIIDNKNLEKKDFRAP